MINTSSWLLVRAPWLLVRARESIPLSARRSIQPTPPHLALAGEIIWGPVLAGLRNTLCWQSKSDPGAKQEICTLP